MWWKRGPARSSAWVFGRLAPRGAFLRGHWVGVFAGITVMVALGLFLPLLGWSLLGFIALDTVIGSVLRRCNPSAILRVEEKDVHEGSPQRQPRMYGCPGQ